MELSALVRDVVNTAEPGGLDTQALTAAVLERIPPEDIAAALHIALPTYVRQVVSSMRGPIPAPPVMPERPTDLARATGHSVKVAAIREHWKAALDGIYPTGPAQHQVARLRDMDADALAYAAEIRERQGIATLNAAARLTALRDAVKLYGVHTVADLGDAVLRPLLDGDTP
jgi:hypothetical protein